MKKHAQKNRSTSPWSKTVLVKHFLFVFCWAVLCSWTPKKMAAWRRSILRLFGTKISGQPFVASSVRIHFPWNLVLADRACIAERCNVYTLDVITVEARALVAQDCFLCCGSHDFDSPTFELMTAPIVIGADAFIGARTIVLPNVVIGERAIIGAGAVVAKDVASDTINAGNPLRFIRYRKKATGCRS